MKEKIITNISKGFYLAVAFSITPLILILTAIDANATNKGLDKGYEVLLKIDNLLK